MPCRDPPFGPYRVFTLGDATGNAEKIWRCATQSGWIRRCATVSAAEKEMGLRIEYVQLLTPNGIAYRIGKRLRRYPLMTGLPVYQANRSYWSGIT